MYIVSCKRFSFKASIHFSRIKIKTILSLKQSLFHTKTKAREVIRFGPVVPFDWSESCASPFIFHSFLFTGYLKRSKALKTKRETSEKTLNLRIIPSKSKWINRISFSLFFFVFLNFFSCVKNDRRVTTKVWENTENNSKSS